jgi:hypothetical protein
MRPTRRQDLVAVAIAGTMGLAVGCGAGNSAAWQSGYNFAYTADASNAFNQAMLGAPNGVTYAKFAHLWCRQISETPDYNSHADNSDWIAGCNAGLQKADNTSDDTWNNYPK